MRVLTIVLAAVIVSSSALDAVGQSAPQPGSGPANRNTNTLSTGSNRNTNANSNSQFLSGSNTGVNNGSLEVYSGSEPYQGIILEGSTSLPQLPGIPGPPSNFSQPYRPETFVNTPPFLPTDMTLVDAKRCRDAKVSWYGDGGGEEAAAIRLIYAARPDAPRPAVKMTDYVGTAIATTSDGPFLAALCEAAYRAMRKGATVGMIEFAVRPKNTMFGVGFGASGGATGLPAAGTHPYAIASALGFGTGWSNQRVEGEVVIQLTALRGAAWSSAIDPGASSPSPAAAAPRSEAPAESPAKSAPASGAEPSSEKTGNPPEDPYPPAAPRFLRVAYRPGAIVPAHAPSEDLALSPNGWRKAAPAPAAAAETVAEREPQAYRSPQLLAGIRKGQSKERLFQAFATAFVERDGKIVEVPGMRLRASGRSGADRRIEVGEVLLAERGGPTTPYWFLFEDARLVAWGRPEQWEATVKAHGLAVAYKPRSAPRPSETRIDLVSGR